MESKLFVEKFMPFARISQEKTGVPALVTMAQAALESGWGDHAPGNNFFGIKDFDGTNGNEQLLRTVEYHDNPNVHYPVILGITKISDHVYKYDVRDYFKKYPTPEGSFTDHGTFLRKNKRYMACFRTETEEDFVDALAKAGYATDSQYANKLKGILITLRKWI